MGPPLQKSDWVLGAPEIVAKIILKGMAGEITVSGKTYKPKVPMLPFESLMTDQQIADTITYIRNSWGNKAAPVSADKIQKIRADIKDRKTQYSEKELRK